MNDRRLKPCPFCGDTDVELRWRDGRNGLYGFVQCNYCGAQTRTLKLYDQDPASDTFYVQETFGRIARLWNKRKE